MNPIKLELEISSSFCPDYIDSEVEYICDKQICDHYKFSIYMTAMFMVMDKV